MEVTGAGASAGGAADSRGCLPPLGRRHGRARMYCVTLSIDGGDGGGDVIIGEYNCLCVRGAACVVATSSYGNLPKSRGFFKTFIAE